MCTQKVEKLAITAETLLLYFKKRITRMLAIANRTCVSGKTRMNGLSCGEKIMTIRSAVLIQYQCVTDRRTDGQNLDS